MAEAGRRFAARQHEFGQALMDPAWPAPRGLVVAGRIAEAERFNVYRNNVVVGLVEALEDGYPAAARLVGREFFRAAARIYVAFEPPDSPVMSNYGAGFPDFIGGFEPASMLPYLADVARVERAWVEAYHAAEARPMDPGSMAAIDPQELPHGRFVLHPSVSIVRSRFPAVTIWRMNVEDAIPSDVDIDSGGEDALIARPDAEVEVRRLPAGAALFIAELKRGLLVVEASERAMAGNARFDLAACLAGLMESRALVDFISGACNRTQAAVA